MTQDQIQQKAQNLLACIQHGLQLHDDQSTTMHLGDRSQYIGLSDIGRALECPRAALCNKVFARLPATLQKLLTLQRGHWLEHGIGQAINAQGIHAFPQLELSFMYNNTPIKAHFDFVLAWENPRPAIRILELKSTKHIPETLYTAYETQLYGQASFLASLWNKSAFSLRDADGTLLHENLTMPELCNRHFGLILPNDASLVDIEAWVLCLSMDDIKPFGPYIPHASMRDVCLRTAKELWANKEALSQGELHLSDVPHATGFHALCGYCDWNSDCPKFHDGDNQPDWEPELEKLISLKEARAALDVEISLKEQYLKDAYGLTALQGDWINTGSYRFKVSQQKGRRTLNKDLLQQTLQKLAIENAKSLIASCEQEGKPFQKLTINKIN